MPCCCMTGSSTPRRPRRAPWISGCRVLTRPSMISGKAVTAETSVTSTPSARRSAAVPPVESRLTSRSRSARAKSTRPSLLDTLSNARRMVMVKLRPLQRQSCASASHGGRGQIRPASRSAGDAVVLELLAQSAAVDAEDVRGAALVALGVAEHGAEQRLLDLAHHEVVEMPRPMAVQAREVTVERLLGVRAQ